MALRKQPLAAGVAALVFSSWAAALGLGEITLNSALNEPLDAEIRLLNVGNLSEAEVIAGLASREDFARAGVEREFVLSSLRFDVDLESGAPVIRISSRDPIREPYLDFLVNLEWTSGRLLREYTLLLDLPVFSRDAIPASSPAPAASTQAPVSRPATSSPSPSTAATLHGGTTHTVAGGETLWRIASQLSGEGSVHQKMTAIHQANPDAFIDGNINLLRRGAVLRLPAGQEVLQADSGRISSTSSAAGDDEPSRPAWNAQPDSQSRQPADEQSDSGRLSLAVEDEGSATAATSGSGSGTGAQGGSALRTELDLIQEELERTQRENAELKSRLSNLESQIGTMERMIELGSDELRAGQLASAGAVSERDKVPDTRAAGSDTHDETADAAGRPGTDNSDQAAGDDASQPAPAQDSSASTTTEKASSLTMLKNYLAYVLGAVVLLIVALVVVVRRRRGQDVDFSQIAARREKPRPQEQATSPEDGIDDLEGLDDLDEGRRVASVDEIELHEADDFFSDQPPSRPTPEARQPESLEEMELDLAEFDLGEAPATDQASTQEAGAEAPDLPVETSPEPDVASEDSRTSGGELDLDDFDFLGDSDAASTQLELARAYIDMGDKAGARDILEEVAEAGNEAQKEEARTLLSQLS